jgi:hypothetical protein
MDDIILTNITKVDPILINPGIQQSINYTASQIKDYCSGVNGNMTGLLVIVFIMWLIEPILRKNIKDSWPWKEMVLKMYKMLGLGLIAIVLIWFYYT